MDGPTDRGYPSSFPNADSELSFLPCFLPPYRLNLLHACTEHAFVFDQLTRRENPAAPFGADSEVSCLVSLPILLGLAGSLRGSERFNSWRIAAPCLDPARNIHALPSFPVRDSNCWSKRQQILRFPPQIAVMSMIMSGDQSSLLTFSIVLWGFLFADV